MTDKYVVLYHLGKQLDSNAQHARPRGGSPANAKSFLPNVER